MDNNVKKETKLKNKKIKVKKKKKFSWKLFLAFILFEFVFTTVTAPFVLLYGPFDTARKTFLGTAMGSMHYQWLATTFMSEKKINKILGISSAKSKNTEKQDTSLINVVNKSSRDVKYYPIKGEKYDGYVLEIANPLMVHVGYSSKLDQKEGEKTSQIAKNNKAIAAINGGSFTDDPGASTWIQNGGNPTGIIISNGKEIFCNVDKETKELDVAAIDSKGNLIVGLHTVNELLDENVKEALCYGPALIVNGKKLSNFGDQGTAPKTLIGQKKDGTIVMVCLDSNTGLRICATLKEAQDIMAELGCWTATNLDGGKSTTMYYRGEVRNNPSFATGERKISAGFIVK